MEIVVLASPVFFKISKNKNAERVEITMLEILYPNKDTVKTFSNFSYVFKIRFALLFPLSASTLSLNWFKQAKLVSVEEKKAFLLRNRIAVWDVIHSCDITGSSDASIRNVVPNDLSVILDAADIRTIFVNGKTAERYYRQYTEPRTGRPAVCLPSTSPANAAWSVERLAAAWQAIRIP